MNTFEVRSFKSGRWNTDSRCNSKEEALAIANTFAANRSFDGVKVVEEAYDEDEGLFREKTVFSYFKQDDKVFNPLLGRKKDEAAAPPAAPRRRVAGERGGTDARAWLLAFGLLLSLCGNVALAIYLGDGKFGAIAEGPRTARAGDLIVYDLPLVATNYRDESGTRVLRMRLGLELAGHEKAREIQDRLSSIINRVASDLSRMDDGDLTSAQGLNELRKSLHEGVQNAAGDTPVEGVLFKEVVLF
jgi:flagellar basal body-associated protein FliL